MSVKTSYSQNNTYIACPKHWHLSYKERWENPTEGASTHFGSAIDAAVGDMLESSPDWLKTFYDRWNRSFNFGKATQVFDNDDIIYGYKDFDEHILEAKHKAELLKWGQDLGLLTAQDTEVQAIELYKDVSKLKKNPYKSPSKVQMKYYNRASWLSMKVKGKLLLNAFHVQFYPKIKKVLATQVKAQIQDPNTGDTITGFIDMILEIDGYDKPVIFDLKTAAYAYNQEDIDLTQQLTLYAAMKGTEYNTDLVGYVVLTKNIPKNETSTCLSCGNIKSTSHQTCEATVNGVRCKGQWNTVLTPEPMVQVLVEKKEVRQIEDLLIDYGNIILAMKNEVVYKNVSKCNDWYGGKCPFYDACHKNDYSSLKKKK